MEQTPTNVIPFPGPRVSQPSPLSSEPSTLDLVKTILREFGSEIQIEPLPLDGDEA